MDWLKLSKASGHWKKYGEKLVTSLETGQPFFKIFSKGNSKLPFYAFSSLPKYSCPGAGQCLDWCYSFRAWRYPAAFYRQVQNFILLKFQPDLIRLRFDKIPQNSILRLYVDGDFDSPETIRLWFGLLNSRRDIQCYGYSKSWDLLHEFSKKNPDLIPNNYKLNLSSGGKKGNVKESDMELLPFFRGRFIAVKIPDSVERSSKRYSLPEYHQEVREAALAEGHGKVFSCPGKCGSCATGSHACGSGKFNGIVISIGIH